MRSVTVELLSRDTCEKCDSSAVVTKFEGLSFGNARMRKEMLPKQHKAVTSRD